ncbi:hypothetical protein [Enterococcus faecium]|uniref:hypothetical protein n=1 Tax=Enterococcus faecium TaxID=1352 RepID=UPI003DA411D1
MLINQITNVVNDAVKDALGTSESITALDSSNIVALGKKISDMDAYEPFFKSLANRIARTVYFVRSYSGSDRHILRDEHDYGAFIQKVYYKMPEAVDNPTYNFSGSDSKFQQVSPFDVETTVEVTSMVFGGQGTWSVEIVRPLEQVKQAFTSPSAMASFIDGIYVTVDNAYEFEMERIVALADNTAMASAIAGGQGRNLLKEYNTAHSTTLTPAQALESADFLKYASMEINRTVDNMSKMTTVFNAKKYETFTPKDRLIMEMLSQFASASDMYLQADTFHNELVKLPNFEKVPYWQRHDKEFSFSACSSISIKNTQLANVGTIGEDGAFAQSGIIAFVHDEENVAAYFGERHSWEMMNPRSDVMIHGEKARKGFAVDDHANAVVFYIAS